MIDKDDVDGLGGVHGGSIGGKVAGNPVLRLAMRGLVV